MARIRTEGLKPLQLGRLSLTLDKLYNFDGKVKSLRDHIAELKGEKREWDGTCDWNRRHFNRLGADEQRRYEARLNAKRYYTVDGFQVPKIVYDAVEGVKL